MDTVERVKLKRAILKRVKEENAQLAKESIVLGKKAAEKKAEALELEKEVAAKRAELREKQLRNAARQNAIDKAIAIGLTSRHIRRREVGEPAGAVDNNASQAAPCDSDSPNNDSSTSTRLE
ncbi:hypothetical protein CAEBREN_06812 [Caenorhabditis brenneri]|uniref:Uncharacterized protein n=1 Tax=Caenorhabditis brenneri TaxID=135651 RepID=G0NCY1_CAEBE|nr:hypothetical protein CAEBREN_06812 [Caenorhabditis brenneri]